jgi:hypothetical protein
LIALLICIKLNLSKNCPHSLFSLNFFFSYKNGLLMEIHGCTSVKGVTPATFLLMLKKTLSDTFQRLIQEVRIFPFWYFFKVLLCVYKFDRILGEKSSFLMKIWTFIAKKVTFNEVLRTFLPALSKLGKIKKKKVRKWKNCLSDPPKIFLENTPP